MKSDRRSAVKTVAMFCNRKLSDDDYDKVVAHTSFEHMKNNPATNHSTFFRKGEVGDWNAYLTDDQMKYVDHLLKENTKPVGLTFDEHI